MRDSALFHSKILVVDDEDNVVEFMRRILTLDGYEEIRGTTDPLAVVALFREFQPDLVILDLVMPGYGGLEVLADLRAIIPPETYLPILVITGYPTSAIRREVLHLGASDFVTKPFDTAEILARVENLLETLHLGRRKAAAAAQETEETFFAAFAHAPIGVALVSPEGRWLKVNQALCDLVGYSNAEMLERGFQDITHPEDLADGQANLPRLLSGEVPSFQAEKRYIHARGHIVTALVNVTLVRDGQGRPRHFVTQVQDITERKRTEDAIRESEERFSGAFQYASIGVALVSLEGRWLKVNRALCDLVGYSEAEMLASSFQDITHRDDLPANLDNMRRLLDGDISTYQMEKRYIHARGHDVAVLLNVSLFRDRQGQPRYFIAQIQEITARKRAEAELHWKTALLEAQVNSSPDGVLVVDQQGKKILQNQRLTDLLKIPQHIAGNEDDRGQVEWVTNRAVDPNAFIEKVLHLYAHPDETSRDEIALKDGTVIDRYSAPVLGKDGGYYGRIWVFRDITERKQAEETLRLLSSAVEQSKESIIITDAELDLPGPRILFVNPAFTQMTGYAAGEVLGETPRILQGPQTDRTVLKRLRETLERGEVFTGETVNYRKDGTKFDLDWQIAPIRNHAGKITHFVAIQRDATERRRAAEELFQSRETLRGILDHIPQRVFWKDRDLVYQGCNHSFALDMGFSEPSQVIGKTDRDGNWKPMAEIYREIDRRVVDLAVAKNGCEEPAISPDGRPMWIRISRIPLHDQEGQVTGMLGTYEDVTEHKLAVLEIESLNANLEKRVEERTEELFAVTREAEHANRAKTEFLSRTSHELRTPLNAILGFGQILETEANLGLEARDSIDQLLQAARHLLVLIDKVLAISDADSGQITLAIQPVTVAPLVEEALCLVRSLGAAHQVELELPRPIESQWRVLADAEQLSRALLNLFSNAIRYNRPGGKVIIECAPTAAVDPPTFRFGVQDTGPGISAENIARLFTPFDRLDAERIRIHSSGTGLGLALSQRMIKLMGGRIGVESVLGGGSTFWIEVPLAENPGGCPTVGALPDVPDPRSSIPKSKTLLYFEDDVSSLRLVAHIVARRPAIHLLSAKTSALGLETACTHRPDLILLDRSMHASDNDPVLAQLRADLRTSAIPVAMLCDYDQPDERERLMTAGVRVFLTKPVEVRAFLGLLDQFIAFQPEEPG